MKTNQFEILAGHVLVFLFHLKYSFWEQHSTGPTDWVSWDETGYGAPVTSHAPVVHSMTHNMFNGLLNVFIFGDDGSVHHIWQTTCDKVPNPWGWCTWSVWNTIGDKVPPGAPSLNPLSIGNNIHKGIEVSGFSVGFFVGAPLQCLRQPPPFC